MFVDVDAKLAAEASPALYGSMRNGKTVWDGLAVILRRKSPAPARTVAALLPLLALACSTAAAQTQIDLPTQTKRVDFTGATYTRPFKAGTILPATCVAGDMFFKTDAAPGLNVYGCSSTNNWTVESSAGSSGGGSLTIDNNGVAVGSRSVMDLIAGTGFINLITDTGSQINVQLAVDTALVQTLFGEQSGTALFCASQSGSSTAYSCAMNPTAPAYTNGMLLHWLPDTNSGGGPTTLNVDTIGAKSLKLDDGVSNPLSTSIIAGKMYLVWYDGSVFRLLSAASGGSGSNNSGAYVADPGANGIPYRSAPGTAAPATASNISGAFACVDGGSANAYACSLLPAIGAYSAGTVYWFRAGAANTGPSTVNLNSLGAVAIKKFSSQDLSANDIRAGQWVMIVYDGSNMQMMSQTGSSPAGSASSIRSRELFLGGYNNWGLGWAPGGAAIQTTGGWSAGDLTFVAFNHNSAANAWEFRWDANWDNTQPVSVLITAADTGGNGGNFKLDWTVACLAAGTNIYLTPPFGAVSSTGPITLSGTGTKEIVISGLDVATASCAPNMMTVFRASRDNTITGNSADDLAVYSATVTYSVK